MANLGVLHPNLTTDQITRLVPLLSGHHCRECGTCDEDFCFKCELCAAASEHSGVGPCSLRSKGCEFC